MKQILSGATSTEAGDVYKLGSTTHIHTLEIIIEGSLSALSIALNGGINKDNMFQLYSYELSEEELSDGKAMFHVVDRLVEFVQVEILSITGTGVVSVSHSPANSNAYKA